MLELKSICKDYLSGDNAVHALRDVSICFRPSEFVAILGPSGCGKTTLLNLIGGLDQYTSGDLVISGRSTKQYNDRDWDTYRNHSIGFVFQSYNLISHQSVLQNVELALTLSGVGRAERRRRAIAALEQVGLGDQLHKKPNQMSGGQMQRVAIARALVNNPEILLADEPTGALDSETSVQIMELLKEIAREKLVIMVTHNPDLAQQYATRTVRLLDGRIVDDTAPYTHNPNAPVAAAASRRSSMGFWTAFALSANNLMTKKARTILTAFAGSIGIIGIALILSLSNGIQTYIDDVQEDTLSSYPITIEAESMDMSGMVTAIMGSNAEHDAISHDDDRIYASTVMSELMNTINSTETKTNDLQSFRDYLKDPDSPIHEYLSSIQYSYDLELPIYATDADGNIVKADVMELLENMMGAMYGGDYSSYFSQFGDYYTAMDVWQELLCEEDGIDVCPIQKNQYEVLTGSWPEDCHDVVLIVSENNEISDLVMYAMGLRTEDQMESALENAMEQEMIDTTEESWSYDELVGRTFKLILPCESYQYDETTGTYSDLRLTEEGLDYLYGSDSVGTELRICGIVRPTEDSNSNSTGSLGYTGALTREVISRTLESDIVCAQLEDETTDVLTALPFRTGEEEEPTAEEISAAVASYLEGCDVREKSQMYLQMMQQPTEDYLDTVCQQAMADMTRESIESQMTESYAQQTGVDLETMQAYIAQMDDETLFSYVEDMIRQQTMEQYAEGVAQQMADMTNEQMAAAMDMAERTDEQNSYLYDTFLPPRFSESTYEDNLDLLGYATLESPDTISLYCSSFADKDEVANCIAAYNEGKDEDSQITYTDYVALLMSSITTIINAISYVLIAFVAISLVVSSIMIGIITYISVLERTKEIGILRAIGASKRDVARVFNAETLVVGLISGLIGIGMTLLLIIPINAIVRKLTEIPSLGAALPPAAGVILVLISMVLTLIAGVIPSRFAAKKDPVVALRTD